MAGPRLEVFKFGLYLFVPITCMMHYAKPEWYTKHVLPVSVSKLSPCDGGPAQMTRIVSRSTIPTFGTNESSGLIGLEP